MKRTLLKKSLSNGDFEKYRERFGYHVAEQLRQDETFCKLLALKSMAWCIEGDLSMDDSVEDDVWGPVFDAADNDLKQAVEVYLTKHVPRIREDLRADGVIETDGEFEEVGA